MTISGQLSQRIVNRSPSVLPIEDLETRKAFVRELEQSNRRIGTVSARIWLKLY